MIRGIIFLYKSPWQDITISFDHRTYIQHTIDACMNIIPHYRTQFPSSRINYFPVDLCFDVAAVMSKIRDLCPGPEIAVAPYNGIAHIR